MWTLVESVSDIDETDIDVDQECLGKIDVNIFDVLLPENDLSASSSSHKNVVSPAAKIKTYLCDATSLKSGGKWNPLEY